jgi:hypothetical protein
MISIVVFNKDTVVGIVKIPKPNKNEVVSVYGGIQYNGHTINIMYLSDLDYGIQISDEMFNKCKNI